MLNFFHRNTNKKFLSAEGVGHLWEKIRERFDPKLDRIEAKDDSVTIDSNNVVGVQVSPKTGNILTVVTTDGEEGVYVPTETDPTVPAWAKEANKPSYTPQEVGALPDDTFIPSKVSDLQNDSGYLTAETDPTVPSWAKAQNKPSYTAQEVGAIDATLKGAANGVAELDAGGKVPSSQLPAYVDDVLEFNSRSAFPQNGESGKVYVAADTNVTYRWSGSTYVIIGSDLALGETENTAYRGDRGKAAYDHATAKGSAYASGLYKITTNAEGHVTAATAVEKSDITGLGIPGSMPTNVSELQNDSGYLTTETDPTVPSWAKQESKPTYTAGEVGLGNVANERQYSANNPPPADAAKADKVTSAVNGNFAGLDANGNLVDSGKNASDFLTSETDPTVPSWAKQQNPPTDNTKADKVSGATAGDFAGLDANGNLTDSGKKASDFTTAEIVSVSDTQPSDSGNKLWIDPTADETYTVPTYAEHQALSNALSKSSENTSIAISAHAIGDLFWYNGTLHIATSAIAVGDTIVDTGTGANCKDTTISEAMIKDVQINGTSILQNGVANIPFANNSNAGAVKVNSTYGIKILQDGILRTNYPDNSTIKQGSNQYTPIVPYKQDVATFYGLSKLAGVDLASGSDVVGVYPESAKSAISQMLNGAVQVTGTTPVITAKSGIRYICGEVSTLSITLPASGDVEVIFESGSTATVLTVTPPTGVTSVKWAGGFDPTSLDADTVYDMIIMDGKYGMVVSWT